MARRRGSCPRLWDGVDAVSTLSHELLKYPLRCAPLFKPKIWGGRGLETVLGKRLPPGQRVGEAWEVADVPEGTSAIAGGPLDGMNLHVVMERFGDQLLPGRPRKEFPLLVKFIDAQDDISIQVHPDAEVCRQRFPTERSKNETWLIMHVEPGGAVLHGVRPGVTLDEIHQRVADGSIVQVMRRIEVRPGDVIHLPAGTLHALLRGVMLLEVQEPSDSTFRVYDHDRLGLDGKPRELHIEQAIASLRLNGEAPACIKPQREMHPWGERELLVDIAPYHVERLTLHRPMMWRPPDHASPVLVVIEGALEVSVGEVGMPMRMGESAIVPPAADTVALEPAGRCQIVIATPH